MFVGGDYEGEIGKVVEVDRAEGTLRVRLAIAEIFEGVDDVWAGEWDVAIFKAV